MGKPKLVCEVKFPNDRGWKVRHPIFMVYELIKSPQIVIAK